MCTTFWSRNSSHLIHGLHILRPKFGVLRLRGSRKAVY
jgi:hypothetical protein